MTQIGSIFSKDIGRHIEGVIKADDEQSLRNEVEEYVLTNDSSSKVGDFLDAYNVPNSTTSGVWISGFFGSGKSHLLKMLSLVLEQHSIDDTTADKLFLPKCENNEFLKAGFLKALSSPSASILFNIDQKADLIAKEQPNAVLAVFAKVFDEMCGYFGKQPHIAKFERDLDSRGLLQDFRKAYAEIAKKPWETGREQALLEGDNIDAAYARVSGNDSVRGMDLLDRYERQYKLSIEDFAELVNKYIEDRSKKEKGFRLNFFVDEVGQYIAGSVKLMTNLQTISESLSTRCKGRAWLIVTAQQELKAVIGEFAAHSGTDFSKIQDRFPIRINLTSKDVAEVIQRRLLEKNAEGVTILKSLYATHSNDFRTLFDFSENTQTYRSFKDEEHFCRCYPFVPYQFDLFQNAIQTLSEHNAFEGQHRSIGERSMLSVFQHVTCSLAKHDVGNLATFDLMFEGLKSTLTSTVQQSVIQAERSLGANTFTVRLLKALFLIKYIKGFKGTRRNLRVLMTESFDQDITELDKNIEKAIQILERESYIQSNGSEYEYLTDEEKDVEKEIKAMPIDIIDIEKKLNTIVFSDILHGKKFRCSDNNKDYEYTHKLDGQQFSKQQTLIVHVISPFYEEDTPQNLTRANAGTRELLVLLPNDDVSLIPDMRILVQTERYVTHNTATGLTSTRQHILTQKSHINSMREEGIRNRLKDLISRAELIVGGAPVECNSNDPFLRVEQAFGKLIARVYPNARMVGNNYTETMLTDICTSTELTLGNTISEAESVMADAIRSDQKQGLRTTVKKLLEDFDRPPFGWPYAAILCVIAKLCIRGSIEARLDSNTLDGESLANDLINTTQHTRILLHPQTAFTPRQIQDFRRFVGELLDKSPSGQDPRSIASELNERLTPRLQQLDDIFGQVKEYPFAAALKPVLDELSILKNQTTEWYLIELPKISDNILDKVKDIAEPLLAFWNGKQKDIYDNARNFIHSQRVNLKHVDGDDAKIIEDILSAANCFRGNAMQRLNSLVENLKQQVSQKLTNQISNIEQQWTRRRQQIETKPEFANLSAEEQSELRNVFQKEIDNLKAEPFIDSVIVAAKQFEENILPKIEARLNSEQDQDPVAPIVQRSSMSINFDKLVLENENDVDEWLEAERRALLSMIKEGKRIKL